MCASGLLILTDTEDSLVCGYHSVLIHSSIDGHLGYSHTHNGEHFHTRPLKTSERVAQELPPHPAYVQSLSLGTARLLHSC